MDERLVGDIIGKVFEMGMPIDVRMPFCERSC